LEIKHSLRFVKPNRNRFKESFNTKQRTWTNPLDGQTFSLLHLNAFFLDVSYTKGGILKTVRARVTFSPHCYTRAKKRLDDDELIVVTEGYGPTSVDRVFDQERWLYSQSLPPLMKNIQNMSCKRDDDNQVVIHFSSRNRNRPGEGWYSFIRIQVDPKFPDILQLEVRTTHRRPGHVSSSRYPIRFSQHLADLLDD